jgi:hypothetical protein
MDGSSFMGTAIGNEQRGTKEKLIAWQ